MRTRTLISDKSTMDLFGQLYNATNNTTTDWNRYNSVIVSSEDRVIQDVVSSNFKKRMKSGELIINPLLDTHVTVTPSSGSFNMVKTQHPLDSLTFGGGDLVLWFNALGIPVVSRSAVWSGSALAEAQSGALAGIATSKYDFTEDVLSYKQNLAQIRHPLENIKEILSDVKRRRPRKALANSWTYYRFAIMPSVRSLTDWYEALYDDYGGLSAFVRLRSTATSSDAYREDFITLAETYGLSVETTEQLTSEQRVRATVYYKLKRPLNGTMFKYGLTFKNLPRGLWNIYPYSFMVDRVYDVSKVLNASLNALDPNIYIEGGTVTIKTNTYHTITISNITGASDPFYWTISSTCSPRLIVSNAKERIPYNPTLSTAVMPLNLKRGFANLTKDLVFTTDLLALISQQIRSKK